MAERSGPQRCCLVSDQRQKSGSEPFVSGPKLAHETCALLARIAAAELDAVKNENLYEFDGIRGYSQAQGE
ncbi:MAG: hypothetical protein WBN31_04540 [Gammaproteobacteria bacterium]